VLPFSKARTDTKVTVRKELDSVAIQQSENQYKSYCSERFRQCCHSAKREPIPNTVRKELDSVAIQQNGNRYENYCSERVRQCYHSAKREPIPKLLFGKS
jgi:hypothetical protein